MRGKRKMISYILTGVGIISIIYFIRYASVIGINNAFLYVWLFLGVFCMFWGWFHEKIREKGMQKLILAEKMMGVFLGVLFFAIVITLAVMIRSGFEKPEGGADYIVILGSHVYGERMSSNLRYRVVLGSEYLQKNPQTKVILSGGKGPGEDITEAEAMRRYLVQDGIAADRILLEDRSANTDENIENSIGLMSDKDAKVVIVTNYFHLYRAKGIAKKKGLKHVQGAGQYVRVDTIPNSYLREVVAIWKYKLCGQI